MAAILIPLAISVGTAILSRLLFPTKGPRLDDLKIPASSYGNAIPRGWGRFRVTGNIIWGTEIEEKKGGKGGGSKKGYTYYGNFAVLLCQGPVDSVRRIWLNGELVYNSDPNADDDTEEAAEKFERYVRFYPGTTTQEPDDLIQAKEGVANTPAFRGFCYLVFEELPLEKYGNRLPAVSVEVIQSLQPVRLSTLVSDLCLGAGLEPEQFDVTELQDQRITGFVINNVETARAQIEKLQVTQQFDVVDTDGKIYFLKQCQQAPGIIRPEDIGAYEMGNDAPPLFKQTFLPLKELPNEIRLKYLNIDKDYEEGEEYARRTAHDPSNRNVETLDVPQVLSRAEAKTIVEQLLYIAMSRGVEYELFLPPYYLAYDPGRYMACELRAEAMTSGRPSAITPLVFTKKELGANYLLRYEAVSYDSTVLSATGRSTAIAVNSPPPGYTPPRTVVTAGDTTFLVLDIPLIQDTDTDNGLYVAAGGVGGWNGAMLYVSSNNGASYVPVQSLNEASTFGECKTVLAAGPTNALDAVNTLSVTLEFGQLASVAAADLTNGANKALVGNEIIQFQTATLTGARTYTLSNLLRGRRGTEWAVAGHAANERFVLLSDYLERIPGQASDIGQVRLFKALSDNQTLDDVNPITLTPAGVSLKPYAPVNLAATKTPLSAITLTWTRRDRKAGDRTDYANFPMSEASERYEVEVMNGAAVARTLVSNKPSVDYTAAQQITDFGSVRTTLSVRVYQMSGVVGRGTPAIATLTPATVYAAPILASIAPERSPAGTSVIIKGTALLGATAVTVNTIAAAFTVNSDTQITATVPAAATTGLVAVTTPGGTVTGLSFTVLPPAPTITNFNPVSGIVGETVTLTGTNFTGATSVKFNNVPAAFIVATATQISAVVPQGSGSGLVTVTTTGGIAASAAGFTVTVAGAGRNTANVTTGALANNEQANITAALAQTFTLLRIQTSDAARVRLYTTVPYRNADANRPTGTDPTGEHGLIVEVVTTQVNLILDLAPLVLGANLAATPSANIPGIVTNLSGGDAAITSTFTFIAGVT